MMTAIAAMLIPAAAMAADSRNQGCLIDNRGEIATGGFELRWHTSDWTPERALAQCDSTNRSQ